MTLKKKFYPEQRRLRTASASVPASRGNAQQHSACLRHFRRASVAVIAWCRQGLLHTCVCRPRDFVFFLEKKRTAGKHRRHVNAAASCGFGVERTGTCAKAGQSWPRNGNCGAISFHRSCRLLLVRGLPPAPLLSPPPPPGLSPSAWCPLVFFFRRKGARAERHPKPARAPPT